MQFLIFLVFCGIFSPALTYNVQKRDVPEETSSFGNLNEQKDSGSTNLNAIKFQYEWTIRNFSLFSSDKTYEDANIKSPTFSITTTTGTNLWFLKLSRKDSFYYNYYHRRKIEISLNLESEIDDEILVEYKFTTLNSDKTSRLTESKDASYSFGKNKKSNGTWLQKEYAEPYYQDVTYKLQTIQDTIIIKFEGKYIVPTTDTLITKDSKSNLSLKAIEEILHFLYTGQTTNIINFQKGLLLTSDNLELKEKYEEELYFELNINNSAEIYKFLYLHGRSEMKNKVMRFIKKNGAAVKATKGWMSILSSSDASLISEVISAFENNAPISNDGSPEFAL